MKQSLFLVAENTALTDSVQRLILRGDSSAIRLPGQFVELKTEGIFLRRPFSVCDWDESGFTVVFDTVGRGTELLRALRPGDAVDALTGLGNGFDLSRAGERPLLVGGGTGFTPIYALAKALLREGKQPTVILGFASKTKICYENEFRALGVALRITTADGSYGQKGFVTDAMGDLCPSYFYACGPEPMLRALCAHTDAPGEMSFEARMGCGFGACMGCSRPTKNGLKRVCKDGPVFTKEEVLWED